MEDISVQDLKQRLDNKDKFLFLDVREDWEYEEDNLGAKNIPLSELPTRLNELADFKDSEIIVHCRSGARSANAKNFLTSKGFSQVRNTLGGIIAYRNL
jgi:rhodanese-related sulfurtransferase